MSYKTEFPHYASTIPDVFLAAPWTDASWQNDACPCFSRRVGPQDKEIHVYVEEDKPSDGPRYVVRVTDEEGTYSDDEVSFASDSLVAVLDHVGFLVGEVAR